MFQHEIWFFSTTLSIKIALRACASWCNKPLPDKKTNWLRIYVLKIIAKVAFSSAASELFDCNGGESCPRLLLSVIVFNWLTNLSKTCIPNKNFRSREVLIDVKFLHFIFSHILFDNCLCFNENLQSTNLQILLLSIYDLHAVRVDTKSYRISSLPKTTNKYAYSNLFSKRI